MSSGLSVLFPVVFLLALALLIGGVAYLVVKMRSGERLDLSFRLLLTIYLYLMTIVSLLVFVVGLSSLVNTGLASIFGRDFSYSAPAAFSREAPPPGYKGEMPPVQDQQAQREQILESNFRNGFAEGISLALVGGLVWALHLWGQGALRRRPNGEEPFLRKAYLAVLLVIFSVGGILALSQGISDTVRHILAPGANLYTYRPPPGGSLATAIVFVPIWIYYFAALWRELRTGEGHP